MKKTESFKRNIIPFCLIIWTISLYLFDVEGAGLCTTDEYSHSLFGKCVPCSGICKPLNRSDCIRKCPDYIRKMSCPIDHYWHTVYAKCIPCSIICSPQNRTTCQSNCGSYIDSLKIEDTTVPKPTTNIPLTISNWAEKHIVYIVILASSFVLSIIGACIALYLCRPKVDQYLQCGRNGKRNTNTVQETNEETSMPMMAIGRNTQDTPT